MSGLPPGRARTNFPQEDKPSFPCCQLGAKAPSLGPAISQVVACSQAHLHIHPPLARTLALYLEEPAKA